MSELLSETKPMPTVSRRLAIAGVVLLGHLYAVSATTGASLVTIGLISFAAVAQLAPATLGGLYWTGATRHGALAGIVGGSVAGCRLLLDKTPLGGADAGQQFWPRPGGHRLALVYPGGRMIDRVRFTVR